MYSLVKDDQSINGQNNTWEQNDNLFNIKISKELNDENLEKKLL